MFPLFISIFVQSHIRSFLTNFLKDTAIDETCSNIRLLKILCCLFDNKKNATRVIRAIEVKANLIAGGSN